MENRYLSRGKRIDNGEWVKGYLIVDEKDYSKYFIGYVVGTNKDGTPHDLDAVQVDPSTICQCTGIKDKNGKLIWENDIIECKDDKHNFQTQIEWDAYCAGFIFQDTETSAVGLDAITANGLYSESKVVGNVFDNPELLEVHNDGE